MSMQMVPKGSMLEDVEAGCQVDADVWQVSSGRASQAVGHERGTDNVSAGQDRLRHVLHGISGTQLDGRQAHTPRWKAVEDVYHVDARGSGFLQGDGVL